MEGHQNERLHPNSVTLLFLFLAQVLAGNQNIDNSHLCWVGSLSQDMCCDLNLGPRGDYRCFDEGFTFEMCCPTDHMCQVAFDTGTGRFIRASTRVTELDLGTGYTVLTLDNPAGEPYDCAEANGVLYVVQVLNQEEHPVAMLTACLPVECRERRAQWAAVKMYTHILVENEGRMRTLKLKELEPIWPALKSIAHTRLGTVCGCLAIALVLATAFANGEESVESKNSETSARSERPSWQQRLNSLALMLSMRQNWKRLVAQPDSKDVVHLHVARFVCVVMVISLHTAYLMTYTCVYDPPHVYFAKRCTMWMNPCFVMLSAFTYGMQLQKKRQNTSATIFAAIARLVRSYVRQIPIHVSRAAFFGLVVARLPLYSPNLAWTLLHKRARLASSMWLADGDYGAFEYGDDSSIKPWNIEFRSQFQLAIGAALLGVPFTIGFSFAGLAVITTAIAFTSQVMPVEIGDMLSVEELSFAMVAGLTSGLLTTYCPLEERPRRFMSIWLVMAGTACAAWPVLQSAEVPAAMNFQPFVYPVPANVPFCVGVSVLLSGLTLCSHHVTNISRRTTASSPRMLDHFFTVMSRIGFAMASNHLPVLFVVNAIAIRHAPLPCDILVWLTWSALVCMISALVAIVQWITLAGPTESIVRQIFTFVAGIIDHNGGKPKFSQVHMKLS